MLHVKKGRNFQLYSDCTIYYMQICSNIQILLLIYLILHYRENVSYARIAFFWRILKKFYVILRNKSLIFLGDIHTREVHTYTRSSWHYRCLQIVRWRRCKNHDVISLILELVVIFTVSLNSLRVPFWAGNGRFARHEGSGYHHRQSVVGVDVRAKLIPDDAFIPRTLRSMQMCRIYVTEFIA